MQFNGREVIGFNPAQLMNICKINHYNLANSPDADALKILSLVTTERDANRLVERIKDILYQVGSIPISKSLDELCSIATIPNEFDGGLDGIDALSYSFNKKQVEDAINVLTAVKKRFVPKKV